uniref:Ig-like domain-containing protein n=1 Tax=Strigamia maritima TaxID=126957 RepID=T1JLI8_STRMM
MDNYSSHWFVKGSKGDLQLLRLGDRVSQKVDALVIRGARVSDSGTYVCVANNLVGAEQAETLLTVTAPLHAKIEPAVLVAEIKKPAAFACVISGSPVSSVTWMKDGKPIVSPKPVRAAYNEKLRIESVTTEDRGMYQCIVENDYQIRQATAELRLG